MRMRSNSAPCRNLGEGMRLFTERCVGVGVNPLHSKEQRIPVDIQDI